MSHSNPAAPNSECTLLDTANAESFTVYHNANNVE
jgi:hypothetical protein